MAIKFSDWFFNKLHISGFPYLVNTLFEAYKYDTVINVSDEYYTDIDDRLDREGINRFWFPMNESKRDVGLNSVYGAMVVLWEQEKKNKSVLLNCHSGVNRSVTVQCAYHYMRTGEHLVINRNGYVNPLVAMCHRGYLPPKAEMEKFLTLLFTKLTDEKRVSFGGVLDSIKLSSINNF